MGFGGGLVEEEAGRFDDDVGADFVPFKGRRVLHGGEADFVAVDDEVGAFDFHISFELPVNGVVGEHVSEILGVEEVVDADDLDVFAEIFDGRAEDHASDASEAIDANFNHDVFCFVFEFEFGRRAFKSARPRSVNRGIP